MYIGIQKAIEETVDMQLEARRDNIQRFLGSYNPQQAVTVTQLLPAAAGLASGDELYQVTDASGAMIFQSPAMRELEIPLDVSLLQHHYRHDDVRVLASRIEFGGTAYRIEVATDINRSMPFWRRSGSGHGASCRSSSALPVLAATG